MKQEQRTAQVLIAESDQSRANNYASHLSATCDSHIATSGTETLSVLDTSDIDVVLFDETVPGISGNDIVELISAREYRCEVILITETTPDFDVIETGFDAYLTRPVSESQLIQAVNESLLRAEYDQKVNELYTLSETRATLEANNSASELADNPRYATLTQRIDELEAYLDSVVGEFGDQGFTAAIERAQTVAIERTSEQRYRSLTEDVLDSSRVGTVIIDADEEIVWANSRIEEHLNISQDALLGESYPDIIDDYYTGLFADEETPERIKTALTANDSVVEFECRVADSPMTDGRWLEHWSKPILVGLYAGGRVEHYYDITDRKWRSRTLETLHTVTRELIQADAPETIISRAVHGLTDAIALPHVGFYRWDEETGELRLSLTSEELESSSLPETLPETNPVWQSFIDRDEMTVNADQAPMSSFPEADPVLILPIASHGSVIIGIDTHAENIQFKREFARLLVANAVAAVERADREAQLRQRDEQLEAQNDELRRLNRINSTIRQIDQALVSANDVAEVKDSVCTLLSEVGSYSFVWFGDVDVTSRRILPQVWAGDGEDYLQDVTFSIDEPADATDRIIDTEATRVIENLAEHAGDSAWQRDALSHGYRSVLTTPITHEEHLYGVLEVYADKPDAFPPNERAVIDELSETVGYALHALRQRRVVGADDYVEVEVALAAADDVLSQLARHADTDITVADVLDVGHSHSVLFLSVPSAAVESLMTFADETTAIQDLTEVVQQAETTKLRCCITSSSVIDAMVQQEAMLTGVTAGHSEIVITANIPQSVSVRRFLDSLKADYPAVELLARRDHAETETTIQSLHDQIESALTTKQHEALRTAYQAGFFEWPRTNDSEDVAELLDVAQPTFLQHLRAAERKFIREYIDT